MITLNYSMWEKITFSKAINLLSHKRNFVQLKHAVESDKATPSGVWEIISVLGVFLVYSSGLYF